MKSTRHLVLKAKRSKVTPKSLRSFIPTLKNKYLDDSILGTKKETEPGVYGNYHRNALCDKTHPSKPSLMYETAHVVTLQCCGISEVALQEFEGVWKAHYQNYKNLPNVVGAMIVRALKEEDCFDKRVLIWGRPVINYKNNPNSLYDNKFYDAMEEAMKKIGFKQLNQKPYTNSNSTNKIKVFAGQLP